MKRRSAEHPYRNQSAAPAKAEKPTFTPIEVPRSVFNGVAELRAFENAVNAVERQPGEELHEWLERVARVAEAAGR